MSQKKYELKDLEEIDVCGEFIDQYFNTNSGYTVDYNGREYTTKNNYNFIMLFYDEYDPQKKVFKLNHEGLDKMFWRIQSDNHLDDLHNAVIDPDDNDETLSSTW